MLAENIFEKMGFTEKMKEDYNKYAAIADKKIFEYSKAYMNDEMTMEQVQDVIDDFANDNIHKCTVRLLFILGCTGKLYEKYIEAGRTEQMFINAVRDILFKTVECEKRYGVFGIAPLWWFDGLLKMTRFSTIRLQFDKTTLTKDPIKLSNYTVETGDLIFKCHIPSDGPLTYEKRYASYKELYEFYKDELKDGILVMHCDSWLLFPDYIEKVFDPKSNIVDFSRDFEIYDKEYVENFGDCWRIFNKDFDGDVDSLPQETSLQKAFVKFMKESPNTFGGGSGVILFDGENILSRK